MRSITRHPIFPFAVFVLTMVLSHPVTASEVKPTTSIRTDVLYDPLFGIEYRPSEVHFEVAPDAVYRCKNFKSRRGDLFLFGKLTKGKVHFYFVYGWQEVEWDGHDKSIKHYEAESDDGIIVVISSNGCRDIGAGYVWSTEKSERKMAERYGITGEVVSALIDDTIKREIRAFGGKEKFFQRLAAAGVDESKLPVIIQEKLATLRKNHSN